MSLYRRATSISEQRHRMAIGLIVGLTLFAALFLIVWLMGEETFDGWGDPAVTVTILIVLGVGLAVEWFIATRRSQK